MAISKLSIINAALHLVGSQPITQSDLDSDTKKSAIALNDLYETACNEMFDLPVDWRFASTRRQIYRIYRLTVDGTPSPAAWSAGATLTGGTSGETCIVLSKESDTVYLIYNQSDDFTDGEVLSDGTNSLDCGTGYPDVEELEPISGYDYQYQLPSGLRRIISMVDEDGDDTEYKYRRELLVDDGDNEIDVLLTDESEAFIRYIHLRTTESSWPGWFVRLVYLNLANLLCEPLKQSKQKKNQLMLMFEDALAKAVQSNGLEDADVSGENIMTDRGNTDVIDAPSVTETEKKYIIQRE